MYGVRLALIGALLMLTACGSTKEPDVGPSVTLNIATCQRVAEPPQVPLQSWSFKEIPADVQAALAKAAVPGAAPFVAMVTSDDVRAILSNHSTFKQREDKWKNRAAETNKCLDEKVKPETPPAAPSTITAEKPKRKRFGLF